jgi:hypothetical protein
MTITMEENPPSTSLNYADSNTSRLPPTHHPPSVIIPWLLFIAMVAFRAAVVAYAYYRSPTYPWARFSRNVGDPETFIFFERLFGIMVLVSACLSLLRPNRKRWAVFAVILADCVYWIMAGSLQQLIWRA